MRGQDTLAGAWTRRRLELGQIANSYYDDVLIIYSLWEWGETPMQTSMVVCSSTVEALPEIEQVFSSVGDQISFASQW